jgi:hypothetical protein
MLRGTSQHPVVLHGCPVSVLHAGALLVLARSSGIAIQQIWGRTNGPKRLVGKNEVRSPLPPPRSVEYGRHSLYRAVCRVLIETMSKSTRAGLVPISEGCSGSGARLVNCKFLPSFGREAQLPSWSHKVVSIGRGSLAGRTSLKSKAQSDPEGHNTYCHAYKARSHVT